MPIKTDRTPEEQAARKRETTAAWARDPANQDRIRAWHRQNSRDKPEYPLFSSCVKNARRRGHECSITREDVRELIAPMRCSVTGVPLSTEWNGPGKNPWAPSIDRIDNSAGYTKGNVRLVCWAYNLAKGEWPDAVFEQLAKAFLETVL